MKTFVVAVLVVLLGMAALMPAWSQQVSDKGITGIWAGALDVQGMKLRVVFEIGKAADGGLTGTVASPDQTQQKFPVSAVTFKMGTLNIDVKQLGAAYEGTLGKEGTEVVGKFTQAGATFPLTLKRVEKAPEPRRRPQEPQKPYPYNEEEVTVENKAAGAKLAGTLTLPREKGPFPAVLLIAGSGPQNRNEEVAGHKIFLVLSDYLTRHGIAVLRMDKRGIGQSTGSYAQATSVDFADDALMAVEYLKQRKEVDARHIGLIGHSEGGLVAPMVAARSKDVAFIALMAGPGLTGEQILYKQGALITRALGGDEKAIARERSAQEKMFAIIKQEKDDAVAAKRLEELASEQWKTLSDAEKAEAGGEEGLKAQVKVVSTPWFRYFLTADPTVFLKQVHCPVLALDGEKDLQVPPKEDLDAIQTALQAAGNKDVTVKELPSLNHLFQTAKTGSITEYAEIEETIAPTALQIMGDWIHAHTTTTK